MVIASEAKRNELLAALPEPELERLLDVLHVKTLDLGESVYEAGETLRCVYFPTDCVVSLLNVLEDGATAEIAVVGFEGVVGLALFMGGTTTPSRAIAQSAGKCLVLGANHVHTEFNRGGPLQMLLLRFTQALITQMSQTAICNRHHSVDQQLCRWLLLSLDRLRSSELHMTQQLIADMLGVHRVGVTAAAGKLHAAKIIEYSRGRIRVLDRPRLERSACECYLVVKKEYDRLLDLPA
jgi:CRP-like cAMP-binding protein